MKKRILCLLLVLMTVVSTMPSFLMRAEATAAPVKTNLELVERLVDIATNYKTLYVMGCFGAPMTDSNKNRYSNNHSYNKQPQRTAMIKAASADTFGFDCVCLIKGVLWGWDGKLNSTYGGAVYASNGVPDLDADRMFAQCSGQSTDFSKIEIGEAVWLKGHIGVYIGNGLAVECTPSWDNCVQITAVRNISKKDGYADRQWTKHGKLPYIEYVDPVIKTSYPSSGTIKVTAKNGTYIKSLPCSEKSNADSQNVETGNKGTIYTVIGLVENVYGNFWYKVKAQNGKEGYLYSGDATYVEHDFGKVTISGVSAPSSIVEGNPFTIKGNITSSKLPIFTVGAYVFTKNSSNVTKFYLKSEEHYVNKGTYQLDGSYVDNNLLFNKLGVGTYTYSVGAVVFSYSADGNKLKSSPATKDFMLYECTFSVTAKPTSCQHSYNSNYQSNSENHWRTCTKCGAVDKKEAHTYDHACDGTCNVCGYTRDFEHDYRLEYDAQYHYKICNICGVGKDLENHQFGLISPKPDGTEDELHWYGCSICRCAASEYHDYATYVITKEPTCKEAGVMTYKCATCGWTKDRMLDKLTTHTYDNDCDPNCNICGETRDAGHNFEWVRNSEGHYLQCTICGGFQETEEHEWHLITPNDEALLKDHHWYGCDICLFAKKEEHAYNSGVVTKQPTCKETGVKTYTCSVCVGTKTETIAKLTTHTYGNWTKVNDSTHKHTCTVCGQEESASHSWNSGVITKQPTKDAEGVKTYTCSVCNGTKTEAVPKIPTYAVVFKNWDGAVLSTKQYAIGEKVTAPAAPTRPDDADYTYTFKGWDKAVVDCNGAATYTATYTAKSRVPSTITSSTHTVSGNTISKIGVGETVEKLLGSLNEGSFVKVYSGNKEVAKDALIGTGMEVKIMDGNTVKATYTAVVTGDTNGDGKISVTDMLATKAHILKKSTLTGAVAQAADTNGDKAISITDFLQLKAHILGKSTVSARSASPASARRVETPAAKPAPKTAERAANETVAATASTKNILAVPDKKFMVIL